MLFLERIKTNNPDEGRERMIRRMTECWMDGQIEEIPAKRIPRRTDEIIQHQSGRRHEMGQIQDFRFLENQKLSECAVKFNQNMNTQQLTQKILKTFRCRLFIYKATFFPNRNPLIINQNTDDLNLTYHIIRDEEGDLHYVWLNKTKLLLLDKLFLVNNHKASLITSNWNDYIINVKGGKVQVDEQFNSEDINVKKIDQQIPHLPLHQQKIINDPIIIEDDTPQQRPMKKTKRDPVTQTQNDDEAELLRAIHEQDLSKGFTLDEWVLEAKTQKLSRIEDFIRVQKSCSNSLNFDTNYDLLEHSRDFQRSFEYIGDINLLNQFSQSLNPTHFQTLKIHLNYQKQFLLTMNKSQGQDLKDRMSLYKVALGSK
ncbi:unnamed protein product [Paramecium pentaurelia]|uniref:Uncharacterized protein n=1 Tax=Paramecium pentaurelia TaxID=43138 RepID=A0A8S1WA03_9CILI|nr:unnamed protein product [Paramecium pentaurelia]